MEIFPQIGMRLADNDTVIVAQLSRPRREEGQSRSAARNAKWGGCFRLGVLMGLQTGKILDRAQRIGDRLDGDLPNSGGPLDLRESSISDRQSALNRRSFGSKGAAYDKLGETSAPSDSHTTTTLGTTNDNVTVSRKQSDASLVPAGRTLDDVSADTGAQMGETVQDLTARRSS